jgi:uncharacterized phage protein (TIGR01671 family)
MMIPKFRAWLIGQEYMAEIEAIAFRGDGNVDVYTSLSGNDFYMVGEECELMQFTGMHDKNGVEIFSGDIVVSSRGVGVVETKIGHAPQVTYKNGNDLLRFVFENLSVIGNIYANQELLEQKNG